MGIYIYIDTIHIYIYTYRYLHIYIHRECKSWMYVWGKTVRLGLRDGKLECPFGVALE